MIRLQRFYANNFKQLQEIELRFPPHGRVLVQGKNEAGKSTLFEAIFFALFGSALATESGARALDDLIRYDYEKARVELDLAAGDRLFKITRSIVRGKTNVWELDVVRGEQVDEIRGNLNVNKRLVAELGFDGDALLNTCFVEQKKLEKLEGLSKAKREESLARLLNLDALVALEGDLKVRAEDRQELERLKKRMELAEIQAELPTLQTQLARTESELRIIELRAAAAGAAEELRAVRQLDAAIRTLADQRDAIGRRIERIDALKTGMQSVKEARDAADHAIENARGIEQLKNDQTEAQRAAAQVPALQARLAALRRLAHLLERLEQVKAACEDNSRRAGAIAAVEARLAELRALAAQEEQALALVEARRQEYAIGEALGDWIAARREAASTRQAGESLEEKRSARDRIAGRFRREAIGLGAVLFVLVLAIVALPILGLAMGGSSSLGLTFALAIGLVLVGAVLTGLLLMRAIKLWRDLARAEQALGQARGEAAAQALAGQGQIERLKAAEEGLARLNVALPETIDLAQSRRVAIAREMENKTKEELTGEAESTRERLLNARAVLGELTQQSAIADASRAADERQRLEQAAQKAQAILDRRQPHARASAQSLGVDLNAAAIQQAGFRINAQVEQIQKQSQAAARLAQEISRRDQQTNSLLARAREAYEEARRLKPQAPAWTLEFTSDAYNAFGKELRIEYDGLGGETAAKQARAVEGELGQRQGERKTRAQNAALLVGRTRELLAGMGQADQLAATPELEELENLVQRLSGLQLGDEAALRTQHRGLVGRVHSLGDRKAQLEGELGLVGQALERGECRAEWETKSRQAAVRERGAEIVSVARRRIVHQVLPATMDYMRRILPAITRDRYHDAQLDPESYKIQVWDERASSGGAFKEKNIFSGGTKDQFSLALRLAFALATLPQERGTAPSFIFLDEPLGSFDDERADALIYLLTEGEIARAFDQIFLISHVHVDERLFTHRIVLESGRVAATDFPRG